MTWLVIPEGGAAMKSFAYIPVTNIVALSSVEDTWGMTLRGAGAEEEHLTAAKIGFVEYPWEVGKDWWGVRDGKPFLVLDPKVT